MIRKTKKKYKNIIFDLDGTIVDSRLGIIKSLRETFTLYSLPNLDDAQLQKFIGPPIVESFSKYFPPDKLEEAIAIYRRIYREENILELELYPHIIDLLSYLKRKGYNLFIATTKEINSAIDVLDGINILDYFQSVHGTNRAKGIVGKAEALNQLFTQSKNYHKQDSILIGDTMYDVEGARAVGIDVGVVLYGYAHRDEFDGEDISFFVENVKEIFQYF